jgi:hypothetical protein
MRIKNKEIRQRRHRKEQTIKAAQRDERAKWANKPAAAAGTAEKATPKPKAAPKKVETATKPKKAPAKKKAEEESAE